MLCVRRHHRKTVSVQDGDFLIFEPVTSANLYAQR
jgi:hypothetical protein